MIESSATPNGFLDFRTFKFRVEAFTKGFLDEMASEGYPEEVIPDPVKQIKSYLLKQRCISRIGEDGKKAKLKGKNIWNIEARKIEDGESIQWTFREFGRKIVGEPPKIATPGSLWRWAPHVWDPHIPCADLFGMFSSPSLPSWLSWDSNVLSGTPSSDATDIDITVHAEVLNDPGGPSLSYTFRLAIIPNYSLVNRLQRNASDSAIAKNNLRTPATPRSPNSSDHHWVMLVLASALDRIAHGLYPVQLHNKVETAALEKQQEVLRAAAQAVTDEATVGLRPGSQDSTSVLVAAVHSLVKSAVQLAAGRVMHAACSDVDPNAMIATQAATSVIEVSIMTQSAVAQAITLNGTMASDVEIMMTANALTHQQHIALTNEVLEATQVTSDLLGNIQTQLGDTRDYRSRSTGSLDSLAKAKPTDVQLIARLGPALSDMPTQLQVYSGFISDRSVQSVRSNEMTSSDMFKCLTDHGCLDLRSYIQPDQFSSCRAAEGAFGDVWKGKLIDGTDVAVKVLRYALVLDNSTKNMKRAMREIYNWSKLDHKNIHKLLGVTMFEGRLGMVSRWMENGTLQQYLKQHDSINRYSLCPQIAEGVAYLHSVDMVHGDLKACNILVSAEGVLKIMDFDYSVILGLSLAFSATTRTGGGTLRWMAPELVLATDEAPAERNKHTDVYALAMTILETITNNPPYFECRQDHQIYGKHTRREHPKRPMEYFPNTEWGTGVWNFLVKCWGYHPTSRPTANDIFTFVRLFKLHSY
ncbi:Ephrin type-A receptor 7 [Rhizoctonia solani]|uniref:Ephrin type-A receptor 7 n=1 Tax=Rhizoctonia solani TaxID=456999 RepID=A0A0K6FMS7_9AGAM|nr:Ephrin type-A receptor 7 [Rhizoctonia solani]